MSIRAEYQKLAGAIKEVEAYSRGEISDLPLSVCQIMINVAQYHMALIDPKQPEFKAAVDFAKMVVAINALRRTVHWTGKHGDLESKEEYTDAAKAQMVLLNTPIQELFAAAFAMKKECDKFRFPDEDRPILHEALEKLRKAGVQV